MNVCAELRPQRATRSTGRRGPVWLLALASACAGASDPATSRNPEYRSDWASLRRHASPARLQDAKFGGAIGWHGSDFKHWDSDLSDYNSAKMGPRVDVVGEVARAVRQRGLKSLVSYLEVIAPGWGLFAILKVDLPP